MECERDVSSAPRARGRRLRAARTAAVVLTVVVVTATTVAPARALAEPPTRVQAPEAEADTGAPGRRLRLGLSVDVGLSGTLDVRLGATDVTYDLKPSVGLTADATFVAHPNFAVGGVVRATSWTADTLLGAGGTLIAIAARPEVRLPFGPKEARFALRARSSVGLALDVLDATAVAELGLREGDARVGNPGIGWTAGAGGGLEVVLHHRVVLGLDAGFRHHSVSHRVSSADSSNDRLRGQSGEVFVQLGAAWALGTP